MKTLISGGTVITAIDITAADVLIEDDKIVAIAAAGSHSWADDADKIIDASGKYVIPGGIDPHTHMELPFGAPRLRIALSREPGQRHGEDNDHRGLRGPSEGWGLVDGFDDWMNRADGNCAIDYGFHMIAGDINEQSLKEMEVLIGRGCTSFKLFMAYPGVFYSDDGEILRAMQKAAETGTLIMMHAENGMAIDVLRAGTSAR